jgi:hypothetical protein
MNISLGDRIVAPAVLAAILSFTVRGSDVDIRRNIANEDCLAVRAAFCDR